MKRKKIYIRPQVETFAMEASQLLAASGGEKPADGSNAYGNVQVGDFDEAGNEHYGQGANETDDNFDFSKFN